MDTSKTLFEPYDNQNPMGSSEKNEESSPQAKDIAELSVKDSIQAGRFEAMKNVVKTEEESITRLQSLIDESRIPLLKVSSVFPFDLFPDDLVIETTKVNVITREFFGTGRVHSVYIEHINDVFLDMALFFATLRIVDKGYVENTIDIHYLPKKKAKKACKIIQGLVVACKQGINLSTIKNMELLQKVEELGSTKQAL